MWFHTSIEKCDFFFQKQQNMLCLFIVSKRNVSVFDEIRLEKNRKNWKKFAYLPAEDQKNDGHGQLYQHQDEQQDKKLQLIWNISNLFTTCNLTCYLYTEAIILYYSNQILKPLFMEMNASFVEDPVYDYA